METSFGCLYESYCDLCLLIFQVLEKFFDEEDGEEATADEEEDDVDVFASRVYDDDSDSEISDTFKCEFHQHKKDYYRNKLEYGKVTE